MMAWHTRFSLTHLLRAFVNCTLPNGMCANKRLHPDAGAFDDFRRGSCAGINDSIDGVVVVPIGTGR